MSPSYWIFSVTRENWQITRAQKKWAVRTKNLSERVVKGDFIILYVVDTKSFCTAIQTTGNWTPAAKAMWADEIDRSLSRLY